MMSLVFWIIVGIFYFKIALAIAFDDGITWGAVSIMAITLSLMFQFLAAFYNKTISEIGYYGNVAAREFLNLTSRKFRWFWMIGAIIDRVIILLFDSSLNNGIGTVMGGSILNFLIFVAIVAAPFYVHQILFFGRIRNF